MIFLRCLTLAGLGLLVLAGPVCADSVGFDQLVVLNAAGDVQFDSGALPEGQESAVGRFTVPAFSDPFLGEVQVLGLFEPGTDILSDYLLVAVGTVIGGTQLMTFALASDTEGSVLGSPRLAFTTFETGSLQDVTSFFTNLNGSGLTVQVQSDVTPVPEPSTGILGLTALIGIGAVLWRRSRRS